MVYISTYLLVLFCSIGHFSEKFPEKKAFNLLAAILICIVAFRYASVDYFGYLEYYNAIDFERLFEVGFFNNKLGGVSATEVGFKLFVAFEKLLFGSFYLFIALFALTSLLIKFAAFRKMSPYFILSLLLYMSNEYFWKDLGQMRNAFASGVVLWALYYAYQKHFFRFLSLVVLAGGFHFVAFVALPFYWARYVNARVLLIGCLIVSFLIVVFFGGLGSILVELGRSVLQVSDSSKLVRYYGYKYAEGEKLFGGTVLLQTFVATILILIYERHQKVFPLASFFTPVFVLTTCAFVLFNDYGIVGSRINDMLVLPVGCVLIPSVLLLFEGREKVAVYLAILSYCSLWFYMMMRDREPYQSVFQLLF